VGDDVIDVAVGHLAQTILVVGGRVLHAAHGHHAVAVALQAVARSAENLITIFPTLKKFLAERQRESVGFLGYDHFVVQDRAARDGIFHQWAGGTAIGEEIGGRKRAIFWLLRHILLEAAPR